MKVEFKGYWLNQKMEKLYFFDLGNVYFIVLMKNQVNVGLIMVSSKRAAERITELTKDLIQKEDQEKTVKQSVKAEFVKDKSPVSKVDEIITEKIKLEPEKVEINGLSKQQLHSESKIKPIETVPDGELDAKVDLTEIPEKDFVKLEELPIEDPIEERLVTPVKLEKTIPVIRPPIAFPDIKKVIDIPENTEERGELILDIYESIFRAMSIGASKIMGVAPARGLTQKFLPLKDCKELLEGVKVESNSTIDFKKIRENAIKIPKDERESVFTKDFTKIINVITENYGKVMGYGAFRGMVRPEFKIINDSYGPIMIKLGIKDKIHPELSELFE